MFFRHKSKQAFLQNGLSFPFFLFLSLQDEHTHPKIPILASQTQAEAGRGRTSSVFPRLAPFRQRRALWPRNMVHAAMRRGVL